MSKISKAYKLYSFTKDTVSAVTSPLRWTRDKLRGALFSAVGFAVKKTLGERIGSATENAVGKIRGNFDFDIPIPEKIRTHLKSEKDALLLVQEVVNDAISAPFSVVGLTPGKVDISLNEEGSLISIKIEAGVASVSQNNDKK